MERITGKLSGWLDKASGRVETDSGETYWLDNDGSIKDANFHRVADYRNGEVRDRNGHFIARVDGNHTYE